MNWTQTFTISRLRCWLLAVGMVIVLLKPSAVSARQDSASSPRAEASAMDSRDGDRTLSVIQLRHAAAIDAAAVINQVIAAQGVITVDERTNALIVIGTDQAQAIVREIVAELDVELDDEKTADDLIVRIFKLKHAIVNSDLASRLGSLFPQAHAVGPRHFSSREPMRVTFDADTNQLIARGKIEALDTLRSLIEAIDRAPAAPRAPTELQVRLVWLVGGLADDQGAKIPPDMEEVILELSNLGVNELRLAAQAIVRVTGNKRFGTVFVANLNESWSMAFSGRAGSGPGGTRTLDVELQGESRSGTAESKLETSITTVSGHFVVLGVSPIRNLESVFVLQVTDLK